MRRLFILIFALCLIPAARAQLGAIGGFCVQGATAAQVQGLNSTNKLQGILPSCTATVFLTQTQTKATIFSDPAGAHQITNPMTASTGGQWLFYVSGSTDYDVVLSSGVTLTGLSPSFSGSVYAGNINGEYYPAACGRAGPPSWCSGTTAGAWITSACAQLPSTGGTLNFLGLTGTIPNSVPCSTPTKQVIMLQDPTSLLTITENDGGITFPQDNGSMFLGQGVGQCNFTSGGIHLGSSANVTAIVGPAHTDGSQENFTANGLCLFGAAGATVSQGLLYTQKTFTNTTFQGNVVSICPTACIKVLNGGGTQVLDNWLNVSDGLTSLTGTPLIIQGTGSQGCDVLGVTVSGGQIEHALGGGPEILVKGDGTGQELACDIHIRELGVERNPAGTASTVGIQIEDCKNCSVENVLSSGVSGSSADMIKIIQNASGSVANVVLQNISDIFGAYTNLLNDTTPAGKVIPFATQQFIATYYANPGYVQPPVLPPTTIQALGSDAMGGLGNFATGSGTLGTGFVQTGCLIGQGLSCTYTRDNSTAPPGLSWSQKVAITASTDPNGGDNGVQYGTPVSFTAGQTYIASFWGKGDGTYAGVPDFLLWNPLIPVFYCENKSPTGFNTTWTAYSFACTPSTSGTANIAIVGSTPANGTGTFWLGGFTFAPVAALAANSLLSSLAPYGIGPASAGQQTITINGTACQLQNTCTVGTGNQAAITQTVASSTGGTCTMAGATTCTITLGHTYTTPVCTATQQSTGTVIAAECLVSGVTATITAATSNSATWGALVFGNPN